MLNIIPNVMAASTSSNGGWLTLIGYFMYFFYALVVFIHLIFKKNRGKTFHLANQLLGFAVVITVALMLVFIDTSHTKNVVNVILFIGVWIGSLLSIRVALARLQQQTVPKR